MFEKLIVSNTRETGSEGRSRYFIISSLVVLTLFTTAVVLSLYAADISIGDHEFDMARMVAPITAELPEEAMQNDVRQPASKPASELPVRKENIARIDETIATVPDTISTERSTSLSRPVGDFIIDPGATETLGRGSVEGRTGDGGSTGTTGSSTRPDPTSVNEETPKPPPVKTIPPPPTRPISIGVANGHAVYLPKPPYPPHALSVGIEGEVTVQVTIDEKGNVLSAKAAKGHPFLRTAAERAAMNARFTPTLLSKVPVKVTGVIIYNFKRN
ncbi:MAG: TonB family protein [Pyrinomonadaceae bacterium]